MKLVSVHSSMEGDEGEELGVERDREVARRMVEGRVLQKTTKIYTQKLGQMHQYFQEHCPEMLDGDDDFVLPMPILVDMRAKVVH